MRYQPAHHSLIYRRLKGSASSHARLQNQSPGDGNVAGLSRRAKNLTNEHERNHEKCQPNPHANLRRDCRKDHARDSQRNNNAQPFEERFHLACPFGSRVVERENPTDPVSLVNQFQS